MYQKASCYYGLLLSQKWRTIQNFTTLFDRLGLTSQASKLEKERGGEVCV